VNNLPSDAIIDRAIVNFSNAQLLGELAVVKHPLAEDFVLIYGNVE